MIAWLFPGQGAQEVGMGKALYESSPAARETFERANAALGWSISRMCFEGPTSDLMRTANTQPALVTVSVAALAAVREAYPNLPDPLFAAGHSLGEYSALVAAGSLELEDAVRLVHLRGRAMQEAVPEGQGTMAAVLASVDEVAALCRDAMEGDVLSPANFNAPGQIVIAGHAAAVARALSLAETRRLRAMPLKVSGPFHCSLMRQAGETIRKALQNVEIKTARVPVVTNVEARPNTDRERIPELLVRQVDGPVKWEESVRLMVAHGVTKAIEIGPGRVLAGLARRIDRDLKVASVADPDGVERLGEFLS